MEEDIFNYSPTVMFRGTLCLFCLNFKKKFLKGQIIQEGILIIKYLRFLDLLTTVNAVDLQNLKSPESR